MMRFSLGRHDRRDPRRPIARIQLTRLESRELLAQVGAILEGQAILSPIPVAPVVSPLVVAPIVAGPRVSAVQFQPLTGRILVTLTSDSAGYDSTTLTNPANYGFKLVQQFERIPTTPQSRPKAGVVLVPAFRITGVTIPSLANPGDPQVLVVSINNNQPLRKGVYRFTIQSSVIRDQAGRSLDGQFTGTFPTGSGQPGSAFAAFLTQTRHTVLPALPVGNSRSPSGTRPTPVFQPTTQPTIVRYVAGKPGRFTLAGGNNITLIPLPGQNFPGTFRVPGSTARR